eukprot:6211516-Pleurochrysis_carterae.AAC.2
MCGDHAGKEEVHFGGGRPSAAWTSIPTLSCVRPQNHGGQGVGPGDINSVVYFWDVAPRAHCGNVTKKAVVSAFNAMTSGVIQMGACRLCKKIGDARAPRLAGCSKMNSAPAACAARSRVAVRRTPHHVVSVTHWGGPSVSRIVVVKETRHREGRTRGRGDNGGIVPIGAALQQSLIHRVYEYVVLSASAIDVGVVDAIS